jgi:hypothetical protein
VFLTIAYLVGLDAHLLQYKSIFLLTHSLRKKPTELATEQYIYNLEILGLKLVLEPIAGFAGDQHRLHNVLMQHHSHHTVAVTSRGPVRSLIADTNLFFHRHDNTSSTIDEQEIK